MARDCRKIMRRWGDREIVRNRRRKHQAENSRQRVDAEHGYYE
jgi:hypothetical protein